MIHLCPIPFKKFIDLNLRYIRATGTFKAEEERPIYGITKNLNSWNPVWANVAHYSDMWGDIKSIPKFTDKIRYVFEKPGWLPDYMGGYRAPQDVDAQSYVKFNTETAAKLNIYVLVQYILLLAGTSLFLFNLEQMQTADKLIFAGVIIFSVISFGALFENRSWAVPIESLRLIFITLAALYAFAGLNVESLTIIVGASFLIVFQIWLMLVRKVPLPAKA